MASTPSIPRNWKTKWWKTADGLSGAASLRHRGHCSNLLTLKKSVCAEAQA